VFYGAAEAQNAVAKVEYGHDDLHDCDDPSPWLDGTGAFAKPAQNILSVTDGGHDWVGRFLSLAKRLQKLHLVRVQNFEWVWV
jgi:hypothetical protein